MKEDNTQTLVITDVRISFGRIVELLFAWTFAACLVGLVFGVVAAFVVAAFRGLA